MTEVRSENGLYTVAAEAFFAVHRKSLGRAEGLHYYIADGALMSRTLKEWA